MIKKLRQATLILICIFAVLTCYLAIIKPGDNRNLIMMDSFGYSSEDDDTLAINYPIEYEDIKDILFTTHNYSSEYGGEGFMVAGIKSGEFIFHRRFEVKDSVLILGTQKINVGRTFEDVLQYKSLKNVFKIERIKLSLKNEGLIKCVKFSNLFSDQTTISLKKPVLLITGNSYHSFYINKSVIRLYKTLPFILIFLGLAFWFLSFYIKIKSKTKHNH